MPKNPRQLLQQPQDRPRHPALRSGKPRSVVLIDDDVMMRQMLRLILTSDHYQVVGEASNGDDGVTVCEKLKPDLVLLDINMPKMSGLLALEFILQQNPGTKVLMVSVESKKEMVAEAIQRGACGFVVKPLNPASVLDRVESCFKGKG
jgi:DNA-binding NarL/FixJ family response regulator